MIYSELMKIRDAMDKTDEMVQQMLVEAKALAVTPYKIAKETGISKSSLSNFKYKKQNPKVSTFLRLADYVNYDVVLVKRKKKSSKLK